MPGLRKTPCITSEADLPPVELIITLQASAAFAQGEQPAQRFYLLERWADAEAGLLGVHRCSAFGLAAGVMACGVMRALLSPAVSRLAYALS
ncbi:hypothetical protein [Pectobacterium actinidiae]|uniref:hypothetical protein n=1 Tax=Pectobacterium actinidiae TaxID=1507808 RepID=UPI00382AF387